MPALTSKIRILVTNSATATEFGEDRVKMFEEVKMEP